ncbi:MAG: ppcB [Chloroflexi bacterium]|nr:ppcB [Chloroflexota bacterium]
MAFKEFREFLDCLEEQDLLRRVKKSVDWNLEIGAVMHEVHQKQGPAVLFENVKGADYPLLCGAMGTVERYCMAMGVPADQRALQKYVMNAYQQPLAPEVVEKAPCQQNVLTGDEIDLSRFPTPFWHPLDGGRFIGTLGVVITEDPETGLRNAAIYREQVLEKDTSCR